MISRKLIMRTWVGPSVGGLPFLKDVSQRSTTITANLSKPRYRPGVSLARAPVRKLRLTISTEIPNCIVDTHISSKVDESPVSARNTRPHKPSELRSNPCPWDGESGIVEPSPSYVRFPLICGWVRRGLHSLLIQKKSGCIGFQRFPLQQEVHSVQTSSRPCAGGPYVTYGHLQLGSSSPLEQHNTRKESWSGEGQTKPEQDVARLLLLLWQFYLQHNSNVPLNIF